MKLLTYRNTFLHSKSPKIIVVSHTDTIYDSHCVLLWTHAFHESYKSTEKLRIWPVFHILPARNRIHILFFSPGTTYWDYCCTTKKPVTDTAGSTLFSKSLFKLKSFFSHTFVNSAHHKLLVAEQHNVLQNFASCFSTFCMVCFDSEGNWTYTASGLFWQHHASVDNSKGDVPIHFARTSPIL